MSELALSTHDLGMRYGRSWAVRHLSLSVPAGAVYGLLGPNGAGKSTAMRALLGVQDPHEGRAQVLGMDPARNPIDVRRRVGFVPDRPVYHDWMTCRETIAFVAHYRQPAWDQPFADRLATRFRLPLDRRVGSLSKGEVAKLTLLLAMAFRPEILVLDEPTGGLDPAARRALLRDLLGEYLADGNTVLISSHLIAEISGLVDHVGILVGGTLLREAPVELLLSRVKRARLLFDDEASARRAAEAPPAGALRATTDGREAIVDYAQYDPASHAAWRGPLSPASDSIEDLNLEDAFILLTDTPLVEAEPAVA